MALLTACFSLASQAANNYSCNNAAPLGSTTASKVVVDKAFKDGVSYKLYALGENGEAYEPLVLVGVRLSGEGIGGGLCYDSVDRGKQAFGERAMGGMSCDNIKPLGVAVNGVGTYPRATLALVPDTSNYGIRYSGQGIGGGLCFEDVLEGFEWLAWAKGGKVMKNWQGFTGPAARIKGRNGYHAVAGNDVAGRLVLKWN
uniref:hypothetical protein n=1 Tax=Microbulbifer agarilyticus TaxID=260552 RepID=UPI000527DCBD|nr:hypothetical protein [Microbulbifer agarilyticus]